MNSQMKFPMANKQLLRRLIVGAVWLLTISTAFAQELPEPMSPPRLVNDFAGFIPSNEASLLEQKLLHFNNRTSTQIYVVTVKELQGYDPSDYSTRLAEKWGVGQEGKDNGIMIVVKPKTNEEKGEVFIGVGYGLEAVVPDAIANRIVANEILPNFREGNYSAGLNQAVDVLISLTEGEYTADTYLEETEKTANPFSSIVGLIIFIIVMASIFGGRSRMGRHSSVGRSLPFWLLLGMMNSGSRSHGGMFGDFSGGRGGFGGFGGGGGGSFGGGGAGGSW